MSNVEVSLNLLTQQQPHDNGDDGSSTVSGDDDHHTSTTGSDMCTDSDANKQGIADEETRRIHVCRLGLIIVLLMTGAAICAGTYIFVHDQSMNDYKLSVSVARERAREEIGSQWKGRKGLASSVSLTPSLPCIVVVTIPSVYTVCQLD